MCDGEEVTVEEGERCGSQLFHIKNGYYYHVNQRRRNTLNLRCIYYYSKGCHATAACSHAHQNFQEKKPHVGHGREFNLPHVKRLRRKILQQCLNRDPSRFVDIVNKASEGYSRWVRAQNIPARLRSAMHRARLKHFPKTPADLSQLHEVLKNPQYRHLSQCLEGNSSIYAGKVGSARNRTRCLIFVSDKMSSLMRTSRKIFCDSTWDGRPSKPSSSQLFSMVTIWGHQVIPLCFALMESKKEVTYGGLFNSIKTIAPTFQPEFITCDFESGEYSAAGAKFPNARVVGCLFHYAKNVSMYARKLGFTPYLQNSHIFASCVRCLLAIPLVPKEQLKDALAAVMARANAVLLFDKLSPLFEYVYNEYIVKRGDILSVHGCDDRTTNAVESFHAKLQNTMVDKQPNIFQFIRGLLKLEERARQDIYCLQRGISTSRPRKVSALNNDAAILRLQENLRINRISLITFLRHASYRMLAPFREAFPDIGSDDDDSDIDV